MLITLGFYKRKQGLSFEEFCQKWSVEYGSLYGTRPEVTRYLRRYVQHRLSPQTDFPAPFVGFDGFSESWYDSADDRKALHESKYFQTVLKPMAAEFLDLEKSTFAAYDSQVYQVGPAPELFKG
ncbi:EthD domain-containing protein [Pseudochelatococcus sp. B33]